MKLNHKADKTIDIFEDAPVDKDKVDALFKSIMTDPTVELGDTKSRTIEYINKHADSPEHLLVLSILLTRGLEAIHMMAQLEQKTKEAMASMAIHPDMPEEMKDAIRRAKAEAKAEGTDDSVTVDEEEADDFEKLKRKYSK